MPSRLTHRQYIAAIAVSSAIVLILGVLLKPKQLPEPTLSGEETLRLRTLTQRRNLDDLAIFFAEVAGGIQPGLVWLNEMARTGLVWNQEGLIVTAGTSQLATAKVSSLTASGNLTLEPQIVSENFPVSSLQAPQGSRLQPVRKGTPQGLAPGMWIIQIARRAGGNYLYTSGVYGGTASTPCGDAEYQTVQSTFPLDEAALGGGLFDVDGNLLAVVLRCGGHFAAVLPADVDRELARAASLPGVLLRVYGFQVTALDDLARQYFQSPAGVLVTEVTDGQPADIASLLPGDVITAVDKSPVASPEDLRVLTMPEDRPGFQLQVRRNGRLVRIELKPRALPASGEHAGGVGPGLTLTEPAQGYLVETVAHGSRAERASIRVGDRLLRIDGRTVTSLAAVRGALSPDNRKPLFVVLHRGTRKIGTFLSE